MDLEKDAVTGMQEKNDPKTLLKDWKCNDVRLFNLICRHYSFDYKFCELTSIFISNFVQRHLYTKKSKVLEQHEDCVTM